MAWGPHRILSPQLGRSQAPETRSEQNLQVRRILLLLLEDPVDCAQQAILGRTRKGLPAMAWLKRRWRDRAAGVGVRPRMAAGPRLVSAAARLRGRAR